MEPETYYVDIPSIQCIQNVDACWIPVATFDNRKEAIEYAQKTFGADENGCICLVTG